MRGVRVKERGAEMGEKGREGRGGLGESEREALVLEDPFLAGGRVLSSKDPFRRDGEAFG